MQIFFPIFVDLSSIMIAGLMLRKLNREVFGSVPLNKAVELFGERDNWLYNYNPMTVSLDPSD